VLFLRKDYDEIMCVINMQKIDVVEHDASIKERTEKTIAVAQARLLCPVFILR
jgi:hypothetical protein